MGHGIPSITHTKDFVRAPQMEGSDTCHAKKGEFLNSSYISIYIWPGETARVVSVYLEEHAQLQDTAGTNRGGLQGGQCIWRSMHIAQLQDTGGTNRGDYRVVSVSRGACTTTGYSWDQQGGL